MSMYQSHESLSGAMPVGGVGSPQVRLTEKEIQTLIWCWKGKTSQEIAIIQNRSVATVNFHFSNIRRKFDVRTRMAALLKAIESGVIGIRGVDSGGVHEPD